MSTNDIDIAAITRGILNKWYDGNEPVDVADMADEVARAVASALRAATRWVPVAERLPERGAAVLVARLVDETYVVESGKLFRMYTEPTWSGNPYEPVTHWQPLPPAPGKETP